MVSNVPRMILLGAITIASTMWCFTTPVWSQGGEIDELRQRVEKLEKQNAELIKLLKEKPTPDQEYVIHKDTVRNLIDKQLKIRAEGQKKKDGKKAASKDAEPLDYSKVGSDPSLKPKWRYGLDFTTPNSDFTIHVRGRVNWDAGWFSQDAGMPNFEDAAGFRRARIGVAGRMWEQIFWVMEYDFADANFGDDASTFNDLFIGVDKLPYFGKIKAGHFKAPITYEIADSGRFLPLMERSTVVDTLARAPNRNLGISMVRNFGEEDRIWFSTGFFRASSNSGGFDQGDGGYTSISRLTCLPYWANNGRSYVHVGGGMSYRSFQGDQPNDFDRYRTRADVRLGTPFVLDTRIIPDAENERLFSGEFVATFGSLSFQTEALWLSVDAPAGDINYWGTYAQLSYFLTGEYRPYKKSIAGPTRVVPNESFFFLEGPFGNIFGKGAWEVIARYGYLDLRDSNLIVPVADNLAGGTGILQDFTLGLNWYLNPQFRIMLNYIHAWRDSDTIGASGAVDIAAMRFAWNF